MIRQLQISHGDGGSKKRFTYFLNGIFRLFWKTIFFSKGKLHSQVTVSVCEKEKEYEIF